MVKAKVSSSQHANGRKWWMLRIFGAAVICLLLGIAYESYMTKNVTNPVVTAPIVQESQPEIDETPVTKNDIDNYKVPALSPRYIDIPTLGIAHARVQNVGLTKQGALDTPRNISDTAWYNKSAHPGEGLGVVVIDGHNGGVSRDGVFVNLARLKNGDHITIERGDGRRFTYAVVENKTESLADTNTSGMKRLFQQYDQTKQGLSLITCGGKWDQKQRAYDKRVLIRAVAIES